MQKEREKKNETYIYVILNIFQTQLLDKLKKSVGKKNGEEKREWKKK